MNSTVTPSLKVPMRLQRLARFMDNSIALPGGYRIGWDAIIGLIPGFGDVAGTLISGFIVLEGVKLGASKAVVTRMLLNTIFEAVVGTVPVLGDLFDMFFKANVRNVALLESHTLDPSATHSKSKMTVIALAIAGLCFCVLIIWAAWAILIKLLQIIF